MASWRELTLQTGETAFFEQIVDRYPNSESYISCRVHPEGGWTAQLRWPSPQHAELTLTFFLSDGDPSIGLGPWHTHRSQMADFWQVVEGILADDVLLVTNLDGPYPGTWGVVDLRYEDALLELMTGRGNGSRVAIRSFAGTRDGEVDLESYEDYVRGVEPVFPPGYWT